MLRRPFTVLQNVKLNTLSWRKSLSYKKQSIDLPCKPNDWSLYDKDLRHESVKTKTWFHIVWVRLPSGQWSKIGLEADKKTNKKNNANWKKKKQYSMRQHKMVFIIFLIQEVAVSLDPINISLRIIHFKRPWMKNIYIYICIYKWDKVWPPGLTN